MKPRFLLLVEDNPDDEELTRRALDRVNVGGQTIVARDGEEALDFLFGRGSWSDRDVADIPAVALLDLKLPKIDGLEVLKQIRSHRSTQLVPVVFLSSSGEEQDILRAYCGGANGYLRKPVDFTQFIETVRQLAIYWLGLNEPPPGGNSIP